MNKKIVIIGGGTISHVAAHLALSAPAYGSTAKQIFHLCKEMIPKLDSHLYLTRMASDHGWDGKFLETNEDISKFVDEIVADTAVKIVFFSPALVDFDAEVWDSQILKWEEYGKYGKRLESASMQHLRLGSGPKIVDKIRKIRKDITLVAFKTTCGATENEQYIAGLSLLKRASCNLVLANDVKTRVNMIITPEEAQYHVTTDRLEALRNLVDMANQFLAGNLKSIL